MYVKGGGKLGQVGGSIVGLWLSTFRENVRLSAQQKCHWVYPGIVSKVGADGVAGDRRVGGLSASMYRLTVSRWRPNSLAILRMDMPSSLAFCTAFHLACCRNVGLLGEVVTVMATTSSSWMSEPWPFSAATIVSGSGVVSRGSLRPLGFGDGLASPEEGLRPFRSDPGLGGAIWVAMMRPSCCNDSRPSSPCSTNTTAPA